jgi:hypothetical protein
MIAHSFYKVNRCRPAFQVPDGLTSKMNECSITLLLLLDAASAEETSLHTEENRALKGTMQA